jgi:hypothetical protein
MLRLESRTRETTRRSCGAGSLIETSDVRSHHTGKKASRSSVRDEKDTYAEEGHASSRFVGSRLG